MGDPTAHHRDTVRCLLNSVPISVCSPYLNVTTDKLFTEEVCL